MISKPKHNLNTFLIGKNLEKLDDHVLIYFFEQLSKSFNNHINKYKQNNEIYEIGLDVVDSIKYVSNCLYSFKKNNLENFKIIGYNINNLTKKICNLKYNQISEILDYLRTPLTNYLEIPSKLLIKMWKKTKDLELILIQ
jgi:hypothetical protein